MKKLSRGFTLIELLVVIAIIGILSSIVLASLSSARSKGTDAAIQSTASNMRAQAELFYSNNNSYGTSTATAAATAGQCDTVIFNDSTVGGLKTLMDDLQVKATAAKVFCTNIGTAWAVAATLSDNASAICVDSSGASKKQTAVASGSSIGASNATCI